MAKKTPEELALARAKQDANLVMFTHDTAADAGRKGGVASGEAKRKKKTIRAVMQAMLDCQIPDAEAVETLKALGFEGTFRDGMTRAMLEKALKGDVEAGRFVRDTVGEKPREGVDLSIEDKPLSAIDMSKLTDEQLQRLAEQRGD